MQRVGPDVYFSGVITSTFRILHDDGVPKFCRSTGVPCFSRTCGLGWRFGLCWKGSAEGLTWLYFDPHVTDDVVAHFGLTVSVDMLEDDTDVITEQAPQPPVRSQPQAILDAEHSLRTEKQTSTEGTDGETADKPSIWENEPSRPKSASELAKAAVARRRFEMKERARLVNERKSCVLWRSAQNTEPFRHNYTITELSATTHKLGSWNPWNIREYPLLRFTVSSTQPLHPSQPSILPSGIQATLYNSVVTGSFVDTKFLLFSRRCATPTGTRICAPLPVFASSALLKSKLQYFETSLSHHGFLEDAARDLFAGFPRGEKDFSDGYDYESDSDLDEELDADELTQVDATTPASAGDLTAAPSGCGEHTGRVVVIRHTAHRTWLALVFYLYTGAVNFLPLKSSAQGVRDVRAATIVERIEDHPTLAPPCSPKSMYRLADMLLHPELKQKAFDAICSRITTDNVVGEAFSCFTSRYQQVRAYQVSFLRKNLQDLCVAAAFKAAMRNAFMGETPHAYEAVNLLVEEMSGQS